MSPTYTIVSPHRVWFDLEGGRRFYTLSGVFVFEGIKSTSSGWHRQPISVSIPIPGLPRNFGLNIEQYAPLFTLNSIYNAEVARNSGYAIDAFQVYGLEPDINYGQTTIGFNLDIGLSDIDAYINRIGFYVTLKGLIKPLEPVL